MYNMAFMSGVVPDGWKYAMVTSIYKGNGYINNPSNYRQFQLYVMLRKHLQKMQCQLIEYLNEHDFIAPDKSSYRKYHSTASCSHTSIDE